MGVIGSAKLLQALARDNLLPGFSSFGQGTKKADEPIVAIIFTFLLAQVTLFADINQLALFVTMSYLMIFVSVYSPYLNSSATYSNPLQCHQSSVFPAQN